jgi:predicted short-subunit dehydrogenase-like oxidoreductase (DUF2520 family)
LKLGIVGTGRAAAHLGQALAALGEAPAALGGRDATRVAALAEAWGSKACTPSEVLAEADWVVLAVRDEAIAPLCASLPWQQRHVVLHMSGATSLAALEPARLAGAQVAGFHPLQLLADPQPTAVAAQAAWSGIRIGIEAEGAVALALAALARRLGAEPLVLTGAQRALYHAAANAAASGLLAPLDLAARLCGEALGLTAEQSLQALLPLAEGALRAARERGAVGALSGPVARADVTVLAAHGEALRARSAPLAGEDAVLYSALMHALLPLAAASGRLTAEQLSALHQGVKSLR